MAFIDFVFQNGNYVESKDIFDYIEIFLDPIIIIITFILGFLLSNYNIKRKENNELDSLFEYFKIYVKNQKEQISKQIIEMDKQLINVSNLSNIGGLSIINVQPIDFILEDVNKQLLLKAWIKKDLNEQNLIDILKIFNYTKISFENYQIYHKGFLERQTNLREKWNLKIKNFHDYKLSVSKKPKDELKNSKEFIFLNEIYNNWSEQGTRPLKATIDDIVRPLEKYFSEVFNQNPDNPLAGEILKKVQSIDIVYNEWEAEVRNYTFYLKEILPNLKKSLADLNKIEL